MQSLQDLWDEVEARVSALPEGRLMIDTMIANHWHVDFTEGAGPYGGADIANRRLMLRCDLGADYCVAAFPHEGFHVLQSEQCPEVGNFFHYMAEAKGEARPHRSDLILADPADFVAALNLMEIGAYAVGTDFVYRLADAGDDAALSAYRAMSPLCPVFDRMATVRGICDITIGGAVVMECAGGMSILPASRTAFAATIAGHAWYWNFHDQKTGRPIREEYHAHLLDNLSALCETRNTPYFNFLASGQISPRFRSLEREDFMKLGAGYRFNPFDMPGLTDIMSDGYRRSFGDRQQRCVETLRMAMMG